jgi:hypothetical protein
VNPTVIVDFVLASLTAARTLAERPGVDREHDVAFRSESLDLPRKVNARQAGPPKWKTRNKLTRPMLGVSSTCWPTAAPMSPSYRQDR